MNQIQMEVVSIWELASRCRKLKEPTCRQVWEELVKWMYFQFKSEHHVNFGRIGNYGYKIEEKTGNKVPILFFNEAYLKEVGLSPHSSSFVLKPLVKINPAAIATSSQNAFTRDEADIFIEFLLSSL